MLTHKVASGVIGCQPLWLDGGLVLVVTAVEKGFAVRGIRIAGAIYLWIPVIAGKQFVSALAALHHLAMLGHFTRQQIKGDAVMTDHRLAHGAEGRWQLLDDFVLANAQLVMARAVMPGNQIRILEFIPALAACVLKADGESRQILYAHIAQQPHQQTGVDTAREQHADIHRRPLADGHGFAGAVEDTIAPIFQGQIDFIGTGAVGQGPPGFLLGVAIGVNTQPGRGWQLFDTGNQRAWRWYNGMKIQVVIKRHRVEHGADITALEQRRQGRGKAQALTGTRQIQRLDPQTIAGQKQALGIAFPDGKGKHAIELGQQRFAPGVIALEQNFGIATRIKAVAQGFKLGAQLGEVIDRAVEGQRQTQLAVDHRLG